MKASCPSCNATLNVEDSKIPATGARIKCPSCGTVFPVKPGAPQAAGAVPLPGGSVAPKPGAALPSPSISAAAPQRQAWEDEPTRAVPLPGNVPGATTAAAPPSNVGQARPPGLSPRPNLSAAAPAAVGFDEEPTRAVPLPGSAGMPGATRAEAPPSNVTVARPLVPLPGISRAPVAPTAFGEETTRIADDGAGRERGAVDFSSFDAATGESPTYAPTSAMPAVSLPGRVAPDFGADATAIGLPGRVAPLSAPTFETAGDDFGADATAIGLPGRVAPSQYDDATATGAPGRARPGAQSDATAIGLPGRVSAAPQADATATAIGLPGRVAQQTTTAVGLPGRVSAPAGSDRQPTEAGFSPGRAPQQNFDASPQAVTLPGRVAPRGAPGASVPLPGAAQASALELGEDPNGAPSFDDAPDASPTDFSEVPEQGFEPQTAPSYAPALDAPAFDAPSFDAPAPSFDAPGSFQFDDAPAPPPAPAPGYAFDDLPSPSGEAAPSAFGFEDLPAAAPAAPAEDFSELPSPAAAPAFGFEFDAPAPPPPAVNPSQSFGEVDFGAGGDLEFDPTSTPKKSDDDLEVDMSAPIPGSAPSQQADGLEMLSFIDTTAKEAGAPREAAVVSRFHVKRRSGKVFGPFEDAVIIKMLEEGQLLGNEDVSRDAEAWSPIGAEPAFSAAIARLMESPGKAATSQLSVPPAPGMPAEARSQGPSMDRLKQLYEGRMAAVAVVQSAEPVPFKKRLPLIIGIAAGVLVLGTGAFLGTTPYGVFGLKVLFPARVKEGSKDFAELQRARTAIAADTYAGLLEAKAAALVPLKTKEYPEARAVWCQAVTAQQRRYGDATPAELAQAKAELQNIELLGKSHPEVVKALAGQALLDKNADGALAMVGDALARASNADDRELVYLRAEAYGLKKQSKQALDELKPLVEKKVLKALHLAGLFHLMQKEADLAAGRFADALAADPEHVSSAIELARVELEERSAPEKAREMVAKALVPEARKRLAPAEVARALAIDGNALAQQYKYPEALALYEEALKLDAKNPYVKAGYARALLASHQPEKAVAPFKAAYEASPDKLEVVEGYLLTLIELGKMDDAFKVVEQATSRFPANAMISYLSARVEDALDRTKQAESAYLKAATADPKLVDANLHLAALYLRMRKVTEAKPQVAAALEKAPNNPASHVMAGELALAERDYDAAQAAMEKAVALEPTNAAALMGLSKAALAKGQPQAALEHVEAALKSDPKHKGGRLQKGTVLWKLSRFEEAATELAEARLEDPASTLVVVMLGAVQMERGDLPLATATLMTAVQREPNNPDANFYLARVKNLKKEHTGAIDSMKRAIDNASKRPDLRYWMGRIYADAKKPNEAVEQWKTALQLDPKSVESLEALGKNMMDRNQIKLAVGYFEKARQVAPERVEILALMGDAESQGEQWDKAIASYSEALAAKPDLKGVTGKLAQAYYERRKYEEAIKWYLEATKQEPENPQLWYSLGYAYKERKKRGDAVVAFKTYLQKKPDADNKKEIEDEIFDLSQGK